MAGTFEDVQGLAPQCRFRDCRHEDEPGCAVQAHVDADRLSSVRQNAVMNPVQIEAIERATVQAVSPQEQAEIPGWILPFDPGTVGRAKSAVPLAHTPPAPSVLQEIEAAYARRRLPVMLRIPTVPTFDSFRSMLAAQGYREETVTEVQTAAVSQVRAVSDGDAVEILKTPTQDWASVFLGEGFDPVDGASRVKKLGQAAGSLFAVRHCP